MKSSTLPSVRVEPEVRSHVEAVLQAGESLSEFVENAVLQAVQQRSQQSEFVNRGLASLAKAHQDGKYISSEDVLAQLRRRTAAARQTRG